MGWTDDAVDIINAINAPITTLFGGATNPETIEAANVLKDGGGEKIARGIGGYMTGGIGGALASALGGGLSSPAGAGRAPAPPPPAPSSATPLVVGGAALALLLVGAVALSGRKGGSRG